MTNLETAQNEINRLTSKSKSTAFYLSEKFPTLFILFTTKGGWSEDVNRIEVYENRNQALSKFKFYFEIKKQGGGVLLNSEFID